MLIPNKREFLARRLRDAGVLRVLERASRRPGLLVVTYHRIGDPALSPFYRPIYSASAKVLHAQVCYLRDHFQMITVNDIPESGDVRAPSALITFDDGYRDNLDEALPVLEELGVSATFFLPTDLIERPRVPWWDHAAYVLNQTRRPSLTLDWPEPLPLGLAPEERLSALERVIRLYLDGRVADEARFRTHLEERAETSVDDEALGRALFMDWDGVRRLVSAGMTVGSHSHTHRRLASLSEDEQRTELTESKRILEERTGTEIRSLAYPFGWPGTFNEVTQRQASAAGYRVAFSAVEGINRPRTWKPLELRRLNIGASDSPTLFRARAVLYRAFGASRL